jgi:hypothetical protein
MPNFATKLLDLLRGESSRGQKGPFFPTSLTPCNKSIKKGQWSHQESNLDLKFRKLPFYPLNYGTSQVFIL